MIGKLFIKYTSSGSGIKLYLSWINVKKIANNTPIVLPIRLIKPDSMRKIFLIWYFWKPWESKIPISVSQWKK